MVDSASFVIPSVTFPTDEEIFELEKSTTEKRSSKPRAKKQKNWSIDEQIKLLETRKDMHEIFVQRYQKAEAWIELVQRCGWNIKWEVARNKFMYLKSKIAAKKPPTGIEGCLPESSKKAQLHELVSFFTDGSHKYYFPKVIDSSLDNQEESDVHSDHQNTSVNCDNQEREANADEFIAPSSNTNYDDSWLTSDLSDNLQTSQDSTENSNNQSTQQSTQSSESHSVRDYDVSSFDFYSRKKRRNLTQKDIMVKTSDCIERMANDMNRLTSGLLDHMSFSKEIKLKTFMKRFEQNNTQEDAMDPELST